jgi:hypothetical protein
MIRKLTPENKGNDALKEYIFVEAIKPELMIAIASARPRTLDAAVYEAKRLDSIAQRQASAN